MTISRTPIRGTLTLLCALAAGAQNTPPVPVPAPPAAKPRSPRSDKASYNLNLIVLDPGHGGQDKGATLAPDSFEKDATVALAGHLRSLLTARGFTVVYTHPSASDDVSADSRLEVTNRNHPAACLLLHAAAAGNGVHLLTSALTAPRATQAVEDAKAVPLWDTAQAAVVTQSLRLSDDLAAAINASRIPLIVGRTSVRPIDSMTCPAVALELSPLKTNGDTTTPASDSGYQTRVAESITSALVAWRGRLAATAPTAGQTPAAPAPRLVPKPPPVTPPIEVPEQVSPSAAPHKAPAPPARKAPGATAPLGPPK